VGLVRTGDAGIYESGAHLTQVHGSILRADRLRLFRS
jgi:hypothetical protein